MGTTKKENEVRLLIKVIVPQSWTGTLEEASKIALRGTQPGKNADFIVIRAVNTTKEFNPFYRCQLQ